MQISEWKLLRHYSAKIMRTAGSPQYTFKMQLLLKMIDHVLVAMFLIGGVGSVFVIVISFAEDMRELLSKND